MFIRREKSIKEFIQSYPIVSIFVITYIAIWFLHDILPLKSIDYLYELGTGSHYAIHNGEYWRFVTPLFLHGGFTHMLFNSFSLVLFGPALEQMLGKGKFIIAYLGAGILANIATYLINPSFLFSHVGASGAIYGLFGIYVFMVIFRKHLIDAGSAQIVLVIFIIGLVLTFIRPGINEYAHVLGFIAGFILAPFVLKKARPYYPWRNQRYEKDYGVQFNPNRWTKWRLVRKIKDNPFLLFIIFVALLFILKNFLL